ncbi:MAG: hypothetical protein RLZZ01_658 [Actinomycetota bacterium]|jgi:hypothetical protein
MNLVEFFRNLFFDQAEAAKYQADPAQYLADHGITDASYEELTEAATMACSAPAYEPAPPTQEPVTPTYEPAPPTQESLPTPPPPPPPAAAAPPAQVVQDVVNYYVTEVTNVTEIDDRDTFVDNSVESNVIAGPGAYVDVDIDNDAITASGDGAVAGESIDGPVNTGENSGVISGGDAYLDDTVIGDGNTQVNDSYLTDSNIATGDGNAQAAAGGQAAQGDIEDNDRNFDISGGDLRNVNFGDGGSATDQSVTDSYNTQNTDQSVNVDIEDSFNRDESTDIDVDTVVGGAAQGMQDQSGMSDGGDLMPVSRTGLEDGYEEPAYEEPAYEDGYEEPAYEDGYQQPTIQMMHEPGPEG